MRGAQAQRQHVSILRTPRESILQPQREATSHPSGADDARGRMSKPTQERERNGTGLCMCDVHGAGRLESFQTASTVCLVTASRRRGDFLSTQLEGDFGAFGRTLRLLCRSDGSANVRSIVLARAWQTQGKANSASPRIQRPQLSTVPVQIRARSLPSTLSSFGKRPVFRARRTSTQLSSDTLQSSHECELGGET